MIEVLAQFGTHLPEVIIRYLYVCGCFAVLILAFQWAFFFIRKRLGCNDRERINNLRRLI